ncbi:hypothetical protein ACGRHY_13365 [Streptomyces sp. HK10]|uniref:hypothetical protein n=1 Tax=Streptomyces sp. HK10 TaxID=3373255 RepID=UPI0037491B78
MERVVGERVVDGHRVKIVEDAEDEGAGFLLIVDGIPAEEAETFADPPTDGEIRALPGARGRDRRRTEPGAAPAGR